MRALILFTLVTATFASAPLYTSNYPANANFRQELKTLRTQNRLSPKNETQIKDSIHNVTRQLHMPESILWCLLFQESRFNHLLGIEKPSSAQGLGQFIQFSFYEINHELERYDRNAHQVFIRTLGKDVRPVSAIPKQRHLPNSYYNIPTAIVSSGIFLNNRYLHLTKILDKKKVKYDPDLMWLYAAMAYNKGTRTVLTFWNQYRNRYGSESLQKLLSSLELTQKALHYDQIWQKALERIWSIEDATRYRVEVGIHLENILACSSTEGKAPPTRKKG